MTSFPILYITSTKQHNSRWWWLWCCRKQNQPRLEQGKQREEILKSAMQHNGASRLNPSPFQSPRAPRAGCYNQCQSRKIRRSGEKSSPHLHRTDDQSSVRCRPPPPPSSSCTCSPVSGWAVWRRWTDFSVRQLMKRLYRSACPVGQ